MNRYLLILFSLITNNTFSQTSWDPKPETSKLRLARFTASTDGNICNNETLKGKTVYINFWYASCAPCLSEFAALNTMYQKLHGTKDFEFISFTYENSDVIEMIIDKYNIKYPIFYMPKDDLKKLSLGKGYPTSMIIDSAGNITYFRIGGSSDKKEAKQIVLKEIYPTILKIINH